MSELNCLEEKANVRRAGCSESLGPADGLLITPDKTAIADDATVDDLSTWITKQNLLPAERTYIIQDFDAVEWASDEMVRSDGNMQKRRKIRDGNRSVTVMMEDLPSCIQNALKTHDRTTAYANIITTKKWILGESSDGIVTEPYEVDVFIDAVNPASGKDAPDNYPVIVEFREPEKLYTKRVRITTFNPLRDIKGIEDIYFVVVGTPTATEIVVRALGICDDRPITELVEADFVAQAGQTGITIVNNVYTIAGAGMVTGEVILENQPTMTTKNIESPVATSFTI